MMLITHKLHKSIIFVLLSSFLSLGLSAPAQAAMLGTQEIINSDAAQQQKDYVIELLDRAEVRDQLVELGVNPDDAKQRVDAMTEQEVAALTEQLEEMPAGGDIIGLLGFVLVVLLITDLLGVTDVYNL